MGTYHSSWNLVFKPSDFAIINTDRNSDFETESCLSLRDQSNRKLDLRLNYVFVPFSYPFDIATHLFSDAILNPVVPSKYRYIARISSSTKQGYLSVPRLHVHTERHPLSRLPLILDSVSLSQ